MVLTQAVVAPVPALSLGLTVIEARGEPDQRGGGAAAALGLVGPSGRELGATAALRTPGGLALHAWAAAGESAVRSAAVEEAQWGLILSPQPDGSGNSWALAAARVGTLAPAAGAGAGGRLGAAEPNLFELSAQFNLGEGMLLTPGVVLMRQRGRSTVFAGVRTAWQF